MCMMRTPKIAFTSSARERSWDLVSMEAASYVVYLCPYTDDNRAHARAVDYMDQHDAGREAILQQV